MQSSELESGLPDEAEQECIVFFLLVGYHELNSHKKHKISQNNIEVPP